MRLILPAVGLKSVIKLAPEDEIKIFDGKRCFHAFLLSNFQSLVLKTKYSQVSLVFFFYKHFLFGFLKYTFSNTKFTYFTYEHFYADKTQFCPK